MKALGQKLYRKRNSVQGSGLFSEEPDSANRIFLRSSPPPNLGSYNSYQINNVMILKRVVELGRNLSLQLTV